MLHPERRKENLKKIEEMEKLKPCPFCGSKAVLRKKANLETYIVECTNGFCPASYMIGNDYETEEEAVEVWNKRID